MLATETGKRIMMTKMKRANLMPELPWPHEDFARSSSNMLFHTARLTEDNKKRAHCGILRMIT